MLLSQDPSRSSVRVDRLRAMILLAGGVRPSPLSAGIGRALLDLPIDATSNLMDTWCTQAASLAQSLGQPELAVRVIVDQLTDAPDVSRLHETAGVRVVVEQDPNDFRGTAGLLKDLTAGYAPDALILVVTATQLLLEPLAALTRPLFLQSDGITLVTQPDDSPAGVQLLRRDSLDCVPAVGFCDLKEQALPAIAKDHAVRVVRHPRQAGLPIRRLSHYVAALRAYHQGVDSTSASGDPFAEEWQPAFSIVEEGATVDPTARIQDAVVLAGGVVEAGAVVVRSVVCPGAVVKRGRVVTDRIVSAEAGFAA